jgi:two-component system, response regulator PdtaR
MRVLIVEDQPMIADIMAEALTEAGHEVLGPAYRSDDAMTLAADSRPTLAFVDIDLEKERAGLEVARRLEALGTIVIFATAQDHAARASTHAIGLLSKPFLPSDAANSIPVVEAILAGQQPPPPTIPRALHLLRSQRFHA